MQMLAIQQMKKIIGLILLLLLFLSLYLFFDHNAWHREPHVGIQWINRHCSLGACHAAAFKVVED
jgi:hypothetical protein